MDNIKINEKLWSLLTQIICLINEQIGENKREETKAEAEFLEELSKITIKEEEIEE